MTLGGVVCTGAFYASSCRCVLDCAWWQKGVCRWAIGVWVGDGGLPRGAGHVITLGGVV